MASSMNTTDSLGLSVASVSIPAATTRAAPLVSSGKAPPNLPQGVPPLLHNQYIVGPGGLLPAYPQIYGYDDLQMLQSRLPMSSCKISFTSTPSVPAPKTEPSPSLPSAGSLPSVASTTASLLPSASQHTATLPSLPQSSDLASSSLSQLSSSLSNHQSSLSPASVLSSSTSYAHTSVENTTSLQPSTTFSTASTSATSTTSSVVSMASSMNTTDSLGLSVASVSIPAATTRAAPLVSSGKAPPNLPQGVPPLLHNQYIVGPGGLLPAYPQIYGYDDLQMLQSRLPMLQEGEFIKFSSFPGSRM
ncbi:ubiquitin-associated protein 2-like isoform X4 [Tyto alba]|uniref:ubiquitin-associated protein 2-like isoform X4 n=1 Tax=Tyto alba TaxID=56313 RepID=UPI001C67CB9C|nr:ubiquitin-associated protein 2-like isoform X4 [Tyto alba]